MDGFTAFFRTTPDPDAPAAPSVARHRDAKFRNRAVIKPADTESPRLSGAPKAQ